MVKLDEVELRVYVDDHLKARALLRALEPDNQSAPERLTIKGWVSGSMLIMKVRSEVKIETILNTLDDLVVCLSTAEKCLEAVKEKPLKALSKGELGDAS